MFEVDEVALKLLDSGGERNSKQASKRA